jgi:hypothetical protein
MPELRTGARLASSVCTTEVVVVRVADPQVVVECGGMPMRPAGTPSTAAAVPRPGLDGGSLIGKRYGGPDAPVELLCVKPGTGTLAAGGTVLEQRSAKPLPASD